MLVLAVQILVLAFVTAYAAVPSPQAPAPTSPACETPCLYLGKTATCKFRVEYAINHRFKGQPDACMLAYIMVLSQCPVCFHCAPGYTGCRPDATMKTSLPYDCEAGFSNWEEGWSNTKKKWCCEHAKRGCEYDCNAGAHNWKKGWSDRKKDYCCRRENKGCPFDCEAGYANMQSGWSFLKKAWCCEHKERGCPETDQGVGKPVPALPVSSATSATPATLFTKIPIKPDRRNYSGLMMKGSLLVFGCFVLIASLVFVSQRGRLWRLRSSYMELRAGPLAT